MSSFGDDLRRERELRQINLREVSEATKISLRYLQALETNRFDELPGGVFNRGFVRAYSQYIGIDPEAMVNAYLLEEQARATNPAGHEATVLRRSQPQPADGPHAGGVQPATPAWLKWGLIVLVLAGILGGIYAVLLFRHQPREPDGPLGRSATPAVRPVEAADLS